MKKILILGSNRDNTAEYYKTINVEPSVLVLDKDQPYDVGHTSIQDIVDYNVLETILSSADQVYWAFPQVSEFSNADSYYQFLEWLKVYQYKHNNVTNFIEIEIDPYNWNPKLPVVDSDCVVYFGSSTAAGIGVDPKDHYSTLVCQHLNKKNINFANSPTRSGSLDSVFERFVLAPWKPGAIAVVQIPPLYRLKYCSESSKIQDYYMANPSTGSGLPSIKNFLEVYNQQYLFYGALRKIESMIMLARANKVKMVFWLDNYKDEQGYSFENQMYFYRYPEFIPRLILQEYMVDFGNDGLHPGPRSNKILAQAILDQLNVL